MFAVFFLGFSILAIMSGAFSYVLPNIEVALLSCASFFVFYFVINKRKVFLWTLGSSVFISLCGVIYLYRSENLELFIKPIVKFFKTYYYSVVLADYFIDAIYQVILIFTIGIVLYKLLYVLYRSNRLKFIPPLIGVSIVVPGFFMESFSSATDKQAFILYILASFIYYFEVYFMRISPSKIMKSKISYLPLSVVMAVSVITAAMLLNSMVENPFRERVKAARYVATENDTTSDFQFEALEIVYKTTDEYQVQSSFLHQGITLFKVKTEELKYYRSQTFSLYDQGKWINTFSEEMPGAEWPNDPILIKNDLQNPDLFRNEQVEVNYWHVYTDGLIVAPHTMDILAYESEDEVPFVVLRDGSFKSTDMQGNGFSYIINAYIPKYGTTKFREFLNSFSEVNIETRSEDFFDYLYLPQGYEEIKELAESITKGLETSVEKAEAIEAYLKEDYIYNEAPKFSDKADLVPEFLFDVKEGFCQQFATSMAMLLRAVDVPTRFVVGYVINVHVERDDIPEELLYGPHGGPDPYKYIYDSNAHSWVEVYIDGYGWIQYEPTPGQTVIQFYDPLEYEPVDVEKATRENKAQAKKTFNFMIILVILVVLLLMGIIVLILLRYRRNKKNLRRRFIVAYKILLMYLKSYDLPKQDYETVREYGEKINHKIYASEVRFEDFYTSLEQCFYNDAIPDIEIIERLETYIIDTKKYVRRFIAPITYRRLRFVEFIVQIR